MPVRDGSGPVGQGPMTGRGMGQCNPNATKRDSNSNGWGMGLGRRRGTGRGRWMNRRLSSSLQDGQKK